MYLAATIALAAAGFRLLLVRMRDARRCRRGGTNDNQEALAHDVGRRGRRHEEALRRLFELRHLFTCMIGHAALPRDAMRRHLDKRARPLIISCYLRIFTQPSVWQIGNEDANSTRVHNWTPGNDE